MFSRFFWNSWAREYRYLWYVTAAIFVLSLLFLWFAYFNGTDSFLQWQKLQDQKAVDIQIHTFRVGPFEINVPAQSYISLEYFNGGNLVPNTTASYVYLGFLAICTVIILAVITTAEKFWYFVGMTLFILFMVNLRFEVIGLFGIHSRLILAAILALYILPAFYFGRLKPSTPLVIRILVFGLITALLSIAIGVFSSVDLPFFHIYLTSFTGSILLSILFMIVVAHEVIAGFVYLVSSGKEKNLKHITIISAIYLANVVLTGLQEINYINVNFIFINAFLLLTISAFLGIWGLKHRQHLFEDVLAFYPFGALMFLALGAVCFSTIGQLIANGNDPGVGILKEAILFTHAGYGLLFLLYLLSNFGQVLMDELNVYKVMYNPVRMPYFTFGLAGFVATIACILFSGWRDFAFKGFASFYNAAGDMYALLDNRTFSESFYTQAYRNNFYNHRSDYMLAKFNAQSNNFEKAHYYYNLANGENATPFSWVNSGNIYFWENELFKSVKEYKGGLTVFPNSGQLANNAGVILAKLHKIDSAALYFNQARSDKEVKNTAESNFFAMAALEYVPLKTDSTIKVFNTTDPGTLSNALALSLRTGSKFETPVDPLKNEKLNFYTASLLNNYLLYNLKSLDTAFVSKAYKIASDPDNIAFSEALKSSIAFGYYHVGNVNKATEILAEQVILSESYQGRFNFIMGLWALEQNNPEVAAEFFQYAGNFEFKDARFYYAIALTESDRQAEALAAWDSVSLRGDNDQKEIAKRIKNILTLSNTEARQLKDPEKYQFCRYRLSIADSAFFNTLSNTFENPNYKAQALLDFSEKCLERDELILAIQMYQRITGLRLTNKELYENSLHYELRLLARRKEVNALSKQINKGINFPASRNMEKLLYTAIIQEANGDTTAASKSYKILGESNPYFEEAVLAAYAYFKQNRKKDFYPYTLLSNAVQVNKNSIPLLRAFEQEALNMGLDEYAQSAADRVKELENRNRK